MSQVTKDGEKLSLLNQLRLQHASLIEQKNVAQQNLNQITDAINTCETLIENHEGKGSMQQPLSQGWRS